jgi:phosphate transport system protein
LLRVDYHEQLNSSRDLTLRLFAWSRELLKADRAALQHGDAKAAGKVLSDDVVSEKARQLRNDCVELFWKQQPLADEMRFVAAMLQAASDFERIAFHEHELAKQAMRLSESPSRPDILEIAELFDETDAMLDDGARSFQNRDHALADNVIKRSDRVDELAETALERLQQATIEDKNLIPAGTSQLLAIASLKRIAEHAENLAWHIRAMLDDSVA